MESLVRPLPVDRLTELVIHLSGARDNLVQDAVGDALERHGEQGDGLLHVADALVALRRGAHLDLREPAASSEVSGVPA